MPENETWESSQLCDETHQYKVKKVTTGANTACTYENQEKVFEKAPIEETIEKMYRKIVFHRVIGVPRYIWSRANEATFSLKKI